MAILWQAAKESWFFYIPAIIIAFFYKKIEISQYLPKGHDPDACDKDVAQIQRRVKYYPVYACFFMSAMRVLIGFNHNILDHIIFIISASWSFIIFKKRNYNKGFNEGYACAKEDIEAESQRKNSEN